MLMAAPALDTPINGSLAFIKLLFSHVTMAESQAEKESTMK